LELLFSRRSHGDHNILDLYFRGLYISNIGTVESSEKSINYFPQAIQKDPNYAAAYAGSAGVYATWIPGMNRPRDLMPKAKEFALKALPLDNTLADAYSVTGERRTLLRLGLVCC